MNPKENLQIIENLGLAIVSCNDILNQKSVENVILGLNSNPFFKSEFNVFVDLRKTVIKMKTEEIKILSNFVYESLKDSDSKKIALLVSAAQSGKVVDFVHFCRESSRFQVFLSVTAALFWLNIPMVRKDQVSIKLSYLTNSFLYNKLNSQRKLNFQNTSSYTQPF